jgi:hypothetical protein
MWTVWNKKDDINGMSAEMFLDRHKNLRNEETVFLKWVNGRVIWVMGKNTLAHVYGITADLPNDEFIAEYERILAEPAEEPEEVTE